MDRPPQRHRGTTPRRRQVSDRAERPNEGAATPRDLRTLANHAADSEPLLVVGTGSLIGEGFDCPALRRYSSPPRLPSRTGLCNSSGTWPRPGSGKATATAARFHDELTPVSPFATKARTRVHQTGLPRPQNTGPISVARQYGDANGVAGVLDARRSDIRVADGTACSPRVGPHHTGADVANFQP